MQQGLLSAYNPSDALMPPAQQGYRGLLSRMEQNDKGGLGVTPYQVGAFGSAFLPSAGISDVLGFAPDPNVVGGTLPSFSENIDQGNYIDAGLQTLGASGDVMLASAPFAPFLLAPAVGAKLISQFGKSVRGASKAPNQTGLLGKNNEIKDPLIVQHNINETALMESDRLGGLPVPSLAVSKVDNPLLGFGDVTLVGNPNMAKPSGSNPVYRADAYTTRRPKPEIVVNKEAEDFAETLTTSFKDLPKGSSVSQLDGYSVNQSIAEDLYRGFEGSSSNIPLRAKYMIDKGLLNPKDFETQYDITKFVRNNFAETEDYTNYITKLKKDMIASGGSAKERLFVDYTKNGRKYLPATLENYVKIMKKRRGAGEETTFPSMGALRAKLTPKFKNITEVKSERSRVVDREKFEEVKNQVNLDYNDLLSDLSKKLPEKTDGRTFDELFQDLILNRLGSHPYSKPFEPYIDDAIKKSASELREKLKSIPTEYFEVKPQRGVGLDEFEGAIIPENSLKSTEEILKRRGINKIFKYGSDEQRKELMKRFPELMFSVGGLGLLSVGSGGDDRNSLL